MNPSAPAATDGIPPPDPWPANLVTVVLASAVVAGALAMVVIAWRNDGTAINTYLFMDCGLGPGIASALERSAAGLALATTIAGVARRSGTWLWPSAGYFLVEAIARRYVQGQAYSEWALLTDAPRYLTPVALTAWYAAAHTAGQWREGWRQTAAWVLRMALAAVFATHGAEALKGNPAFVDLIISSGGNLLHVRVAEGSARTILQLIGLMDCGIAGAIILWARPAILAWAANWAAVAAFARLTANGLGAYPEVLLRASYFLGPTALWALQHAARPAFRATERPALVSTFPA
jgi:hypothetical protein